MSDIQWWQTVGAQQMQAEEYHAADAVSNSLLTKVDKSPAHALAYLQGESETTPAMAFGTAFHSCALEPEKFDEQYAVLDGDQRTKEVKARKEQLIGEGKRILTAADYNSITGMVASIRQHPLAYLLHDGMPELSMFWTDPQTGLRCKCRPDWWRSDGILVDLKTTEDASPSGFARSVATYKYHMQAAHYCAGTRADRFIFVAVEKKPPYAVGVYELDLLSLDEGERKRRAAMEYWASCKTAGVFPAYQDEIVTIGLPSWAISQGEE
jgi:hypothetical protein